MQLRRAGVYELELIAYIRSLMPAARERSMQIAEFAVAAARLRREYGASETSGGRTDEREAALPGGMPHGPHSWDLARDWTYQTGPNRPGAEDHPRSPVSCPQCSKYGLKLIHEKSHDHVQPADFPAGPVLRYHDVRREEQL